MVRDVSKRFGGISVLINNAGIAAMNHLLLTPMSSVERIFRTNVFGTFLVMREVGEGDEHRQMRAHRQFCDGGDAFESRR